MLLLQFIILLGASHAQQFQVKWGQCGGKTWTGPTACESGLDCHYQSQWYSQCIPATNLVPSPVPTSVLMPSAPVAPFPGPVPTNLLSPMISIYDWTWDGQDAVLPPNVNSLVAFSGWSNIDNALSESANIGNTFRGDLYLSYGGGNHNGRLTETNLASLNMAIADGRLSRYAGICYDVEEGDTGLSSALEASFFIAKSHGKKILVTTSHSAPYGMADKITVMENLFTSDNIDYLSPQLYTTGLETENDYDWDGVSWEKWALSKASVVVSINDHKLYADAQAFFAEKGITVAGYIQWKQNVVHTAPLPSPTPTLIPTTASTSSKVPSGPAKCMCEFTIGCTTDSDCCAGQTCRSYGNLWTQCRENPEYTSVTESCKNTVTYPGLTFKDFGCTSDNDCCNPSAKCGSDSLCRFPDSCSHFPMTERRKNLRR